MIKIKQQHEEYCFPCCCLLLVSDADVSMFFSGRVSKCRLVAEMWRSILFNDVDFQRNNAKIDS
ncbi:MAG: hypothetical protein GX663_02420 [Clostridiales bacterium]|nr:hypothetical protein [Clostridiales bacterium]